MKTYKAGELREDMLVVPVHMLEAATPSEDGPEVVGYRVEWKTNPKGSVRRTLAEQKPTIQLLELDYPKGELIGYEELTTVAQHSRIVAAKDAEIARLNVELEEAVGESEEWRKAFIAEGGQG